MEYLRSLGSAAASTLIQKSGIALPFSLGDRVNNYGDPIWTLYDATKKDDSSPVSVFAFDASEPQRRDLIPLAKNALRKLRTTRHPDILRFIDVVETDTTIHIVTERVQPLWAALERWSSKPAKSREEWLIWGLHRISVALAFINDACHSSHGMIRVDSIYISPSGEWKLAGLDVMSNPTDPTAVLYSMGERSRAYKCPEVHKSGWSSLKDLNVSVIDGYSLGILIHTVFNVKGQSYDPLPATANPPHPPPAPSSKGAIPNSIFPHYKKLLHPTSSARLAPSSFLSVGIAPGSFFADNPLYRICEALEGFALSSESEKSSLLRTIKDSTASFPPEFTQHKVLPTLLTSLGHGGTSASAILPVVLALGKDLPPTEYTATVVGPVVNLFANPDRGTRMALLDGLPEFADKLDKNTVVNKVWPHLQTGFGDTVAVIREATVRSIILISGKLSERILNNDLLRHLAKAQLDSEPSIRTNTCILIGRLAPSLGPNTKSKVLVPAFSRAIKDTFVHARVAGLMALMASVECFSGEDIATKVLPAITGTLVDREKLVRDQAFRAMELFVKRVEAYAAQMPEAAAPDDPQSIISGISLGGVTGNTSTAAGSSAALVTSAAGAAGALAGWAISSLGRKLATSEAQGSLSNVPVAERPVSAPPEPLGAPVISALPSPAASIATIPSHGKGMQLGTKTNSKQLLADDNDWGADSGAADVANAWGDGDLIDINADTDDWGAFEAATPEPTPKPAPQSVSTHARTKPQVAPARASTLSPPQIKPRTSSPLASPAIKATDTWGSFEQEVPASPQETIEPVKNVSLAGLSKEEKAAEMARRREERKQKIAQLKAQKQG
ncbi:N-terminal kinase-like protein [Ceratobasidium theobromae]|uniref:N-terminal kinase-like protein n=1 Tax=Ceratobasidium theobromae TaxID=1582974 RepID=A0A5N5QA92_9AGAM|nr:N-terminal kinase-like protein [Ceratobasidium theobromae]